MLKIKYTQLTKINTKYVKFEIIIIINHHYNEQNWW